MPTSQLPMLRKYDEADFIRDRIQLLVSLYPLEALTVSGSYIYGRDDFEDSPYGTAGRQTPHFFPGCGLCRYGPFELQCLL